MSNTRLLLLSISYTQYPRDESASEIYAEYSLPILMSLMSKVSFMASDIL